MKKTLFHLSTKGAIIRYSAKQFQTSMDLEKPESVCPRFNQVANKIKNSLT